MSLGHISNTKEDRQVGGLVPHHVKGGVPILQYADDTILFMKHDIEKVVNLKINAMHFLTTIRS